jgi:Flp pilus assembly secretin CpaC
MLSRTAWLLCFALAALLLDSQSRADTPASTCRRDVPRGSQVQVQLDVVVAHVRGRLAHRFAARFLKGAAHASTEKKERPRPFVGALDDPRDTTTFLAFLQALQEEGLAKVIGQPRLVTMVGNPASFQMGGEVPIRRFGQVGIQFEGFGTRIAFLPIVLQDGTIRLEVEPEMSSVDLDSDNSGDVATRYARSTQRLHTTADLKAGQTMVIAPAFKADRPGEDEVELVILVTPSLLHPDSAP